MSLQSVPVAIGGMTDAVSSIFFVAQRLTEELRNNDLTTDQKLEMVVRFLDRARSIRNKVSGIDQLIGAICRDVGLYPYASPQSLTPRDFLAYALHMPEGLGEIVFHRVQSEVYSSLMHDENVNLSAPTSFGKSLIIDAAIASGHFETIAIVVPTIALIDETRRRIWQRFQDRYQIITHRVQVRKSRQPTIYILTQERLRDRQDISELDLLIVDEIYKIDPRREREVTERTLTLNEVTYKFLKKAKQFYFLGPNFHGIKFGEVGKRAKFFGTQYKTVAVDLEDRFGLSEPVKDLLAILPQLRDEPTLIFVKSPGSASDLAEQFIAANLDFVSAESRVFGNWLSDEYHPEWIIAEAARRGVGIHHSRVPRAVSQKFVREFNQHRLPVLVCTSTLIEGVNSAAKTVVILDKQINRKNYDFFTYSNIQGRAGRMFHHFVGKVIRYHEPPVEELVDVEAPLLNNVEEAPDELVLALSDEDMTQRTRQRVDDIIAASIVSMDILKTYATMGPAVINHAAAELREVLSGKEREHFLWRGNPKYDELKTLCRFIWFHVRNGEELGVTKYTSLTYWIHDLKREHDIASFLQNRLQSRLRRTVDQKIDEVFRFLRSCEYKLPRFFGLVQDIINEFEPELKSPVDYSYLIRGLENWFMGDGVKILEEYGIPVQISKKLGVERVPGESIDDLLLSLRSRVGTGLTSDQLSTFESSWLSESVGAN